MLTPADLTRTSSVRVGASTTVVLRPSEDVACKIGDVRGVIGDGASGVTGNDS